MTNDDLESLWPYVLTVLPEDLGVSALDCGALSRARKVRDAEGLLRIVLVYALSDLSLYVFSAPLRARQPGGRWAPGWVEARWETGPAARG